MQKQYKSQGKSSLFDGEFIVEKLSSIGNSAVWYWRVSASITLFKNHLVSFLNHKKLQLLT